MHLHLRPYSGIADLPRILELKRRCAAPQTLYDYPTYSDLQALLATAYPAHIATALWENAPGQLVAYGCIPFPATTLSFQIHPAARRSRVDRQILDWASSQMRAAHARRGQSRTLWCRCHDHETELRDRLEQSGFRRAPAHDLRLVRELEGALAEPQIPPGFALRHGVTPAELAAYQELHRAAFEGIGMALDYHRSPAYLPDLDLIATTPEGDFAAFCLGKLNQVADAVSIRAAGEIAVIATHPAYRQHGLGRALLCATLRAMRQRGTTVAYLETEHDNAPARALYARAGFAPLSGWHWYTCETG